MKATYLQYSTKITAGLHTEGLLENISTEPGRCVMVCIESVYRITESDNITITKGNRYGFNDVFSQHEKQNLYAQL